MPPPAATVAGAKVRLDSITAEVRRPEQRTLRFPRVSSCSLWLSLQTARFSRKGQLPWCSIFPSSFCEPRRRSIHLRPLLGFQREPRPGPCDVDKNISDSGTRRVFRHHSAFSGSVPAYFRSEHGSPGKAPPAFPKENPAANRGVPAGFQRLAGLGVGASAKLANQPKTDLNVPKFLRKLRRGSWISTFTFTLQADELMRVAVPSNRCPLAVIRPQLASWKYGTLALI
jgi:hypothetical protein